MIIVRFKFFLRVNEHISIENHVRNLVTLRHSVNLIHQRKEISLE